MFQSRILLNLYTLYMYNYIYGGCFTCDLHGKCFFLILLPGRDIFSGPWQAEFGSYLHRMAYYIYLQNTVLKMFREKFKFITYYKM